MVFPFFFFVVVVVVLAFWFSWPFCMDVLVVLVVLVALACVPMFPLSYTVLAHTLTFRMTGEPWINTKILASVGALILIFSPRFLGFLCSCALDVNECVFFK